MRAKEYPVDTSWDWPRHILSSAVIDISSQSLSGSARNRQSLRFPRKTGAQGHRRALPAEPTGSLRHLGLAARLLPPVDASAHGFVFPAVRAALFCRLIQLPSVIELEKVYCHHPQCSHLTHAYRQNARPALKAPRALLKLS